MGRADSAGRRGRALGVAAQPAAAQARKTTTSRSCAAPGPGPTRRPSRRGKRSARLGPPDRARLAETFPAWSPTTTPSSAASCAAHGSSWRSRSTRRPASRCSSPSPWSCWAKASDDAIRLPPFLREAYDLAEEFCAKLGERMSSSGSCAPCCCAASAARSRPACSLRRPCWTTGTASSHRRKRTSRRRGAPDHAQAASATSKTLTWTNASCWSASSRPWRPTRSATPRWRSSSSACGIAVGWSWAASSSASTATRSSGWPSN